MMMSTKQVKSTMRLHVFDKISMSRFSYLVNIPGDRRVVLSKMVIFPDIVWNSMTFFINFAKCQNFLTLCKIPWQFPDLEKFYFSLTAMNPVEIWRMTLKNNRASLLCYCKLCVSFGTHWWIQIGVTVRKRPIWVKIGDVLYRVTLKFDGWPWKTIGHLSFAVSSFVQHFIAIGEFKLELQSGNAQSK